MVEGGGLALYKISLNLFAQKEIPLTEAELIVHNVIITPFHQVLENAEIEGDSQHKIYARVEEDGFGCNVVTNKLEDFFETGVIDPVKVTKSAVKNAFAMGTQILTSEAAVIIAKEEK